MNQRQERILKLLETSNDWIKADKLAQIFDISTRTIRSDIKKINEECNDLIESHNNYGYHLLKNNSNDFIEIKQDIPETPKQRYSYILKTLLSNPKGIEIDCLLNKLCISTSCFEHDIKVIKQQLNNDLQIIKNNKTISLDGDELSKRDLYNKLLLDEVSGNFLNINELAQMFNRFSLLDINRQLDYLFKEYRYHIREMLKPSLLLNIGISIDRILDKHYIKNNDYDKKILDSKEYSIASDLYEYVSLTYNIKINEAEIINLAIFLEKRKSRDETNSQLVNKQLIDEIIELLKNDYNLDFSNDFDLISGLDLHLESLISRKNNKIELDNLYLREIKHKYPLIFEISVSIADLLQKKYQFMMNESEIGFLALHIGGAYERLYVSKKYRIVLIYPLNQALSNLYINKLEKMFRDKIDIVGCFSIFEKEQVEALKPDLLITTLPLSHDLDIKTVQISLFINENDEKNLINTFNEMERNENKKMFKDKLIKMINQDVYYENIEVNDSLEAINLMCDQLIDVGYISDECKNQIIKRENIAYTSFEYGFAVPHALKNIANESVISIAHLNKPIKWGDYQVKLIILLAIKNDDIDIFNYFFEWLAKTCNDYDEILNLINTKEYKKFIECLLK